MPYYILNKSIIISESSNIFNFRSKINLSIMQINVSKTLAFRNILNSLQEKISLDKYLSIVKGNNIPYSIGLSWLEDLLSSQIVFKVKSNYGVDNDEFFLQNKVYYEAHETKYLTSYDIYSVIKNSKILILGINQLSYELENSLIKSGFKNISHINISHTKDKNITCSDIEESIKDLINDIDFCFNCLGFFDRKTLKSPLFSLLNDLEIRTLMLNSNSIGPTISNRKDFKYLFNIIDIDKKNENNYNPDWLWFNTRATLSALATEECISYITNIKPIKTVNSIIKVNFNNRTEIIKI
nr:hypothetical protein BEI47_05570 [Aliivibrio fischeri]